MNILPKSKVEAANADKQNSHISKEVLNFIVEEIIGKAGKMDALTGDLLDLFAGGISEEDLLKMESECTELYNLFATGFSIVDQQLKLNEQLDEVYMSTNTVDREYVMNGMKERFRQLGWYQDQEFPAQTLQSLSPDMFMLFTTYLRLLDIYRIVIKVKDQFLENQKQLQYPIPSKEYYTNLDNCLPTVKTFLTGIFDALYKLK